eukprot:11155358-Lingulodinium_polyedra.AAC.1
MKKRNRCCNCGPKELAVGRRSHCLCFSGCPSPLLGVQSLVATRLGATVGPVSPWRAPVVPARTHGALGTLEP